LSGERTAIITGAQQEIGAGLVEGFLKDGYNVVATSLLVSRSLTASARLVLVDGDIRNRRPRQKVSTPRSDISAPTDVLVNNAGIFYTKPFTEFTTADFKALVSVNPFGFLSMTQSAVKQMLVAEFAMEQARQQMTGCLSRKQSVGAPLRSEGYTSVIGCSFFARCFGYFGIGKMREMRKMRKMRKMLVSSSHSFEKSTR
jgi:NAD(P)-dependent dehydrogenase (short-subunit alcohol dehydrogenase family)